MKKILLSLTAILSASFLFSQEALKSIEEEYYDFLSLQGIVERPTLGYRTLSDSEWKFIGEAGTTSATEFDESGDEVNAPSVQAHPWQNNNLGTKRTLWQGLEGSNWFTRGFDHSLKLKIYGPEWYNSFNTAAPYGQNDGALWQGKGYNSSLTGGARLEAFGFEVTLKPQLSFSQNLCFDTLGGVFGNNYGAFFGQNIDLVERYGDSAFWTFDWGDTEVRYSWRTFTVGFGTQSPWLGASWLNPMLGSNNAATYPKFDIGLRRTKVYLPFCDWYIGDIEGRVWTGKLSESDYFDVKPETASRLLNGISASYSPSFIPGFTIGLNRIFMTRWRAENLKYIYRLFTMTSATEGNASGSGNDEDQKISLFACWQFPKVGFELYGEFGRDDFCTYEDTDPFHTAIYTVGVKQRIPIKLTKLFPKWEKNFDLESEIIFEWNNFEMSQDFQLQWKYLGYYAHGDIAQGYTNKGQIIGAGTGSFGNSQFLAWKIYYPKGNTMFYFHRYCPNNNSVYSQAVNTASDAEKGPVYLRWYGNFETYYIFGFNTNFFITKDFRTAIGFSIVESHMYHYIRHTNKSCMISASMKYNL